MFPIRFLVLCPSIFKSWPDDFLNLMNTEYIHVHLKVSHHDFNQVSSVIQYIPMQHEILYLWG